MKQQALDRRWAGTRRGEAGNSSRNGQRKLQDEVTPWPCRCRGVVRQEALCGCGRDGGRLGVSSGWLLAGSGSGFNSVADRGRQEVS